jgi:hypothetical protein
MKKSDSVRNVDKRLTGLSLMETLLAILDTSCLNKVSDEACIEQHPDTKSTKNGAD